MVIPVYILPVMAVIFFTAGGVTARKRKTELENGFKKQNTFKFCRACGNR